MRFRTQELITMLILVFLIGCGKDKGSGPLPPVFLLNVDTLTIEVSTAYQFVATVDGETTQAQWYVRGIRGGQPLSGMITSDGFFIAPTRKPEGEVRLTAKWSADTTVTTSAVVIVDEPEGAAFVRISPDSVKLKSGESVKFNAFVHNCLPEGVDWSIAKAYGGSEELGTIDKDGTYTAPSSSSRVKLIVMARSLSCQNKIGIASLEIEPDIFPFRVELEDFNQSENKGKKEIEKVPCGAASGRWAVQGLDYSGDKIWVTFNLQKSGKYRLSVWYSANSGDAIRVRVSIEGCGQAQSEEFSLTEGTGIG